LFDLSEIVTPLLLTIPFVIGCFHPVQEELFASAEFGQIAGQHETDIMTEAYGAVLEGTKTLATLFQNIESSYRSHDRFAGPVFLSREKMKQDDLTECVVELEIQRVSISDRPRYLRIPGKNKSSVETVELTSLSFIHNATI